MLDIDDKIYQENLLLTQAYCQIQIGRTDKNTANMLRSYNPVYNEKHIFSFEPVGQYFTTKWLKYTWDSADNLYDELFKKQLNHKKNVIKKISPNLKPEGRVLIAEIDMTVVDGASEAESEGFIDGNDCPPMDTWFYLAHNGQKRLLFCWIPQPFVDLTAKGIEVNPIDCFYWDDQIHRERKNGLDAKQAKVMTKGNNKPQTFWQRVKTLLSLIGINRK